MKGLDCYILKLCELWTVGWKENVTSVFEGVDNWLRGMDSASQRRVISQDMGMHEYNGRQLAYIKRGEEVHVEEGHNGSEHFLRRNPRKDGGEREPD
jgi:hypothetical protein